MTSENLQLAGRIFASFNEGEVGSALEEAHDAFVMDWSNSIGPLRGVYEGRSRVTRVFTEFMEAWESVSWTPEEILEIDDERLLVVNHVQMRGRGSGASVDAIGVQLWTFEDGRPRSVKLYQSRADALEAIE